MVNVFQIYIHDSAFATFMLHVRYSRLFYYYEDRFASFVKDSDTICVEH